MLELEENKQKLISYEKKLKNISDSLWHSWII